MSNQDITTRVAKAIYEGRNGPGCKPWAHQTKDHQKPYLADAQAAEAARVQVVEPIGYAYPPEMQSTMNDFWVAKQPTKTFNTPVYAVPPTLRPAQPEDWQLVPSRPTKAMILAAHQHHDGDNWLPHSLYTSMLSVAPPSPAPKVSDRETLLDEALRRLADSVKHIGHMSFRTNMEFDDFIQRLNEARTALELGKADAR